MCYDMIEPCPQISPNILSSILNKIGRSGRAWKTSWWMESPPPSTHESWMKFAKLSLSSKGLAEEMMPTGGRGQTPTSGVLRWGLREPSRNFQNPTQISHLMGCTINSFVLQTLIFHLPKFHMS